MSTPAELIFHQGRSNPASGRDRRLYLLRGDATAPEIEIGMAAGVSWPERRDPSSPPFHLKVIHFNDLHGWISDIQPWSVRPIFSRIVHQIRSVRSSCARRKNEGLLVVSAGDDLIGTVFDELLSQELGGAAAHPGYELYSRAGVDATCLGNHDLDLGVGPMCHAIQHDAAFPVLAANLRSPGAVSSQCLPAVVYVIKDVRIGLLGLTTPAEHNLPASEDFQVAHPTEVAARLVPKLRPYCDVLIVLSHLGYSLRSGAATVQLAGDVELAESLPEGGVDLIIGGHTHDVLNEKGLTANNLVNGIPIVQAGMLGRFLGMVDMVVGERAAVTNARLIPTETLPVDQEFEHKYIQPILSQVKPSFDAPIGVACRNSDLSTEAVRNAFASGESAFSNFICDAIVARCSEQGAEIDLAMLDSSSVRAGLRAGHEVSYGDWFNIMPFADTIWILKMSGEQLKALIEDNALRADRPGSAHTERGFLQFSWAVRYRIALGSDRASARSSDITYQGQPLIPRPEDIFRVGCSSFIRVASAAWEAMSRDSLPLVNLELHSLPMETTGLFMRKELVAYIKEHGGVTAQGGVRRDGRLAFD